MRRIGKKGAEVATISIFVFLAVVIAITVIVIINNTEGSIDSAIKGITSCRGISPGTYGYCEKTCTLPNLLTRTKDCSNDGKVCCIHMDPTDVLQPEETGGDPATYDFEVTGITLENQNDITNTLYKCTVTGTTILCPSGKAVTIKFGVQTTNTGTKQLIVKSAIWVVDMANRLGQFELTRPQAKVLPVSTSSVVIPHEFKFERKDTLVGNSFKIIPAAKCVTKECKTTDPAGIYRTDNTVFYVVSFINTNP